MLFILPLQRLYKEKGESMKHNYTLSGDLPEMVQAKLNAMNISEVKHARSTGQPLSSVSLPVVLRLHCPFVCSAELLQGILDEVARWRLQTASGCHSLPVGQGVRRDPQWCEPLSKQFLIILCESKSCMKDTNFTLHFKCYDNFKINQKIYLH